MGNNDEQGVRERIKARLLEATSESDLKGIRQQLKDAGEKSGSIDACVSELRKKGHLKFDEKAVIPTKALPVEGIVESLPWPVSVNGEVDERFVAGMKYEAYNVIRGIRLAQELTKMGLDQAVPIIKMAQEMRQAEGQAAQVLATQLGQATMQSNQQIISAINNLAASQPGAPAPWQAMAARLAEPLFTQAMQQLSASLFKAMPQLGMTQQPAVQPEQSEPAQSGPSDAFGSLPGNITTHNLGELEEE